LGQLQGQNFKAWRADPRAVAMLACWPEQWKQQRRDNYIRAKGPKRESTTKKVEN